MSTKSFVVLANGAYNLASPLRTSLGGDGMERVNRTLAFVLMGFMIAAVGCGGAEPEEMVIEGEEAD